jgi:hypothetical protein
MTILKDMRKERNRFGTDLISFHQFAIDVERKQRYSDPINGEDLVQITNPMLWLPHPISVAPVSLYSVPRIPTNNLHMAAAPAAEPGGYFSA